MCAGPNSVERDSLGKSAVGFTLIELLVVMGIMVLLMTFAVPAFNAIRGATDVTKATYDIAGLLDQARAYAMANNTYVYIGFFEEDGSKTSTTPATSGTGRVVVAMAASRDGTRNYSVTPLNIATPPWPTNTGATLVAIGKLQRFENLHLADFGAPPATGNMARPTYASNGSFSYSLGAASCVSVTQYEWPLGTALTKGQYTFTKVLNFDPQGIVRIQTKTNHDDIAQRIEIGLQPTHGSVAPALPANQNVGDHAVIQIDGMTGTTHIYRP
jgi:prepilin-type N-terminal cleavage/methylation domain-containing protein